MHHTSNGYISDKAKYQRQLRRIEGQVRGVLKMVEEDKYCIDVLTQISAITSSLESVALALLDDHLNHCVKGAVESGGEDLENRLTEVSEAISRLVR
ncbi:MAG: metal-sensitive transcriptional regulator [Micrococcales bacterium]